MLHRAVFVLYDLLIFVDNTFAFSMSPGAIQALDFVSLILALFLGGWYGTMLGIDWYAMVYGPNAEVPAGLFHGFIPHHWRGRRDRKPRHSKMVAPAPAPAATTTTTVKVSSREAVKEVEAPKPAIREWTFDDLIAPKPTTKKKTTARKTVAKKTTRKPAAKKTVKAEQE
ncbi:MAG TPA: hypothetical protein VHQ41_03195 [Patescibacteria group bacterium]|nr:hypothetical protein [Patescibacteria group bacterium]